MGSSNTASKERRAADIALAVFVIIFVGLGIITLFGFTEKKYPFTFSMTTADTSDNSRVFDVGIAMESASYSAQIPIDVRVKIRVLEGNQTDSVFVIFPGSYIYPTTKTNYIDVFNSGIFQVNKQPSGFYEGSTSIMYPLGGCFTALVSSENAAVFTITDDTDLPCKIPISGLDATTQRDANNINTGLTFIIIALTALSIRPVWLGFFRRLL